MTIGSFCNIVFVVLCGTLGLYVFKSNKEKFGKLAPILMFSSIVIIVFGIIMLIAACFHPSVAPK